MGCENKRTDVKGVVLETDSPDRIAKTIRIFPTTKEHFIKGKQVAWEWDGSHGWGQSWYRDPDTSEVKPAWGSSLEFVGRHLDEI